ncbi:MAG: hypothetical protein AVDCRST_MAG19-4732 [uncultured Thermomicrobiales bacterium]|uniref:Uncharacterized protein n=1 Tax=uncultured Thermomicrobiales bacterium TaxID=1645740 RepID=A0A6J4VQ95_9BACT|nr:MAG: hypothetical protein AVDCRST_MAG19-4732 [uncultured Thermomicrobiales bacterium]
MMAVSCGIAGLGSDLVGPSTARLTRESLLGCLPGARGIFADASDTAGRPLMLRETAEWGAAQVEIGTDRCR